MMDHTGGWGSEFDQHGSEIVSEPCAATLARLRRATSPLLPPLAQATQAAATDGACLATGLEAAAVLAALAITQ